MILSPREGRSRLLMVLRKSLEVRVIENRCMALVNQPWVKELSQLPQQPNVLTATLEQGQIK